MTETLSHSKYKVRDEVSFNLAMAQIRQSAVKAGANPGMVSKILTATSELSRNILKYAGEGVVECRVIEEGGEKALEVKAIDHGPGIEDLEKALANNYSSSGTLGLGLPGTKRMVDEFDICSKPGEGTEVRALVRL